MLIITPGRGGGGGQNSDIFSIFLTMKVCCVFSLESPHRGDSNEYTQHTIFKIKKKKITQNYSKPAAVGFFPKGFKDEFETAVVNEPSVFEPLKFYCIKIKKLAYMKSSYFCICQYKRGMQLDLETPAHQMLPPE